MLLSPRTNLELPAPQIKSTFSVSDSEFTETYSSAAMDIAPPIHRDTRAISTLPGLACDADTPSNPATDRDEAVARAKGGSTEAADSTREMLSANVRAGHAGEPAIGAPTDRRALTAKLQHWQL